MSQDLKAQIELTADASGVAAGVGSAKRSLADLGTSAQAAGKQASIGLSSAGDGGADAAAKIERATQNIIGSIQRTIAVQQAGQKGSAEYFAALAEQRGVSVDTIKPYLDQLSAVPAAAEGASHATAGITRELIVLAHEASQGNVKRLGGSLLVLAEYSSTAQAAIRALVSPLTIVAGVAAAVAFVFEHGASQSAELAKSLALTGNAAGITAGQFEQLAVSVAENTKSTTGSARATLQELVSSGRFTGEALTNAATAVQSLSKASGESTTDIAKRLIALSGDVGGASEKLNEQYHFLTAAELAHIRTLAEQGDRQQAIAESLGLLATRAGGVTQSLGLLEGAWNGVKNAASTAINAMLSIGRTTSTQDAIKAVQDQIALTSSGPLASLRQASTDRLKEQLGFLQERLRMEQRSVDLSSANNAKNEAGIAFDKLKEQSLTRQEKLAKELAIANSLADKSGASPADRAKVIADINEKFKDKSVKSPINVDRASLNEDLGLIKDALAARADAYKNAQSIFDAQRAAGLIADAQFYEQERVMIELNESSQLKAIDAEIAARQRQAFTGRDAARQQIENAQAIAKLQTDRVKVLADDLAASRRLDIQQTSAEARRLAGYLANDQAAQRAYDQTKRQYDLELSVAKLSPQDAAHATARAQITNKYDGELQAANDSKAAQQAAGTFNADAQAAFDAQIALIVKFKEKSLSEYDDYYVKKKAQDADYLNGVKRASQTYIDNAGDVAKLTEDAFTKSFSSIEDALVSFATTGKLSFKDLANSIIADIIRIEAKAAISGILKLLGGSGLTVDIGGFATNTTGTSLPTSGGRASGGPVGSGQTFLIGEKGPELLTMGANSGFITPNSAMQGGSNAPAFAPVINNHIDSRSDAAAIRRDTERTVNDALKAYTAYLHAARVL